MSGVLRTRWCPISVGEYTLSDLKKEVLQARDVLYILQTGGAMQCLTAHREDNARRGQEHL